MKITVFYTKPEGEYYRKIILFQEEAKSADFF